MHATKATTHHCMKWKKTPRISIDFRESFGLDLLHAPGGGRPEFKLMPKYLMNGDKEEVVVQYNVTFEHGRMLPNWEELLFTPMGYVTPFLAGKLPAWTPESGPIYSKILDPLVNELYRTDCNIQRLEANIPVFLDHSPESRRTLTIDRVRLVFLEDVVEAPNRNFALLVFSYLDGYKVMQNGSAGGPPEQ